jgi:hypothetical protein
MHCKPQVRSALFSTAYHAQSYDVMLKEETLSNPAIGMTKLHLCARRIGARSIQGDKFDTKAMSRPGHHPTQLSSSHHPQSSLSDVHVASILCSI